MRRGDPPPSTLMDIVASSSNHARPGQLEMVPYVHPIAVEASSPVVANANVDAGDADNGKVP